MTIDEAIKYCEGMAEEQDMKAGFETDNQTYIMSEIERKRYRECAENHRQLVEWLKELKMYREVLKTGNVRGCRNCKNKYYDLEDFPCNDCDNCEHWELMEDEE